MVIVGNLLETEAPLEKIRRTGFSIIDGSEYNTLIEPIPDAVQFVFDRSRPFRRGLRPFFEEVGVAALRRLRPLRKRSAFFQIDASDGPVCVGEILVLWTAQRFHSTLVCGELAHEVSVVVLRRRCPYLLTSDDHLGPALEASGRNTISAFLRSRYRKVRQETFERRL